jgi:hydrogenase maturation protein HypF
LPRKKITIEGIVQGVGFRPFVYRCAHRWDISGWVLNDSRGVVIEAEGVENCLAGFLRSLNADLPPLAVISRLDSTNVPETGEAGFVIRQSLHHAERKAQVPPDTFVCPDCLSELFNPEDRRFRYPFINCTNCGPRYTIVTRIPYDRPNTTMVDFPMCPACRAEYEDPLSRRFHAQPNACPVCGPRLALFDSEGREVPDSDPLDTVVGLLGEGRIVAVKGLGGYHLAVDAGNDEAVRELRRRKARDEKPFAVMSRDLERVARYAECNAREKALLSGVERPIVLVAKKENTCLSPLVAPKNRCFGVMLPYTPLHYLLLEADFTALVMTSANLSEEPIAFRDDDARERLAAIADFFLIHNRRIHARTDDSIARVLGGRPLLLRRSRGFVPASVSLPGSQPSVLALGGELKNTVCFTREDRAFLSEHVGDLKNPEVFASFRRTIRHLGEVLELEPKIVACDLHPDYYSSRFGEEMEGISRVFIQHHHAHLASCLVENGVAETSIGVIFDGIGYGADGRIWGGEFLVGDFSGYRRVGHFAWVPMPGGDAATREPFRMALSYLVQAFGEELPPLPLVGSLGKKDLQVYRKMIEKGIHSPLASSCGRLFDAVAALGGLRQRVSFEGQAAMELEMAIEEGGDEAYPFSLRREEGGMIVFDPIPLIRAVVGDVLRGEKISSISLRFHNALARMVVEVCLGLRESSGMGRVALSGGVFQNRYLTERTFLLLENEGFRVLTHSQVPPNDGGLSLGQAVVAGRTCGGQ